MKKVGDRVIITRSKSVRHFAGPRYEDAMTIVGMIIEYDTKHFDGIHHRPILVRFDDSRESWWASWELCKTGVKNETS